MPLTNEKGTSIARENITGTRISGLLLLPHRGKISTATRSELGLISGSPVIQPTGHPQQPGKEVFTRQHPNFFFKAFDVFKSLTCTFFKTTIKQLFQDHFKKNFLLLVLEQTGAEVGQT